MDQQSAIADLKDRLSAFAKVFDQRFADLLIPLDDVPDRLLDAMRYAALAKGKRVRPFLTIRCCELVGGDVASAWPAAAAIECVHAFSLIHDDLPAMDDDDLRRGQPTCHRQFDEATAILAGDALIFVAFELLGRLVTDPSVSRSMVLALARGAGWEGMTGGQMADILGQAQTPSIDRVRYIHERKTACLFETACHLGALAGRGNERETAALRTYGQMLGQAFQIADDLLDVTGSADVIGKRAGKDQQANKQTFPACMGVDQSRTAAGDATNAAVAALEPFGAAAQDLRNLAAYVVHRNY